MIPLRLVVAALAACALLSSPRAAGAEAYPWVPVGDDIRVIPDPRVEMTLRLALVKRARRSIDIANYDQRADIEVALPLVTALREAANRGVRVRFMVSWSSTVLFDFQNKVGEMLVDPPTRAPIEYVIVGGPAAQDAGWGMLEGVHEKLFLVDGEMLMTTGRGIGEQYLWWLDTAFLIRGPLVPQAITTFERVWSEARRRHRPYAGYLGGQTQRRPALYAPGAATMPDVAGRAEVDRLLAWVRQKRDAEIVGRARVLHFDFLRQARALEPKPIELDLDERLAKFEDPVTRALIARLATAKSVRMAFISTILHADVRRALIEARRRGADVTLFVNTRSPRLGWSREPIVAGGSLWSMALPDLDELLQAGVRVHGFQVRDGSRWLFLHRKLAVLDDTVIFGSHNFNVPSTAYFDEASFEVESATLASELARLFDADVAANGELVDAARVHHDRETLGSRMLRFLVAPYLGYM